MSLSTVILAAGQGKRMRSTLPKVLHPLAGKPLLEHVVITAQELVKEASPIIIYGHEGSKIQHALAHLDVTWVEQREQLGTGHALMQALPHIPEHHAILVLYGDVPLITTKTLKKFIASTPINEVGILTAHFSDPNGFGRIIRDTSGKILRIVEDKDASPSQRNVNEINTGIYLIPSHFLRKWLPLIKNDNAQQEYYLTDIIALATQENVSIHGIEPANPEEVLGINDRVQLASLERCYQLRVAEKLMRQGVTFHDPKRFDLRGTLEVAQDVTIDINVIIEGHVKIGQRCHIGPHTILRNTVIGDDVEIRANSIIDGAEIAEKCIIGPFARLRPGALLSSGSHVGNFVEIKNSDIGAGSKINHLSYIGDSEVGKNVNIGAGTITCNYDGVNKQKTIIGDSAFIGSNSQLVAPVTIGAGATIGAGSTITRDAPPYQLTLCRTQQRSIANWKRPKKEEI